MKISVNEENYFEQDYRVKAANIKILLLELIFIIIMITNILTLY